MIYYHKIFFRFFYHPLLVSTATNSSSSTTSTAATATTHNGIRTHSWSQWSNPIPEFLRQKPLRCRVLPRRSTVVKKNLLSLIIPAIQPAANRSRTATSLQHARLGCLLRSDRSAHSRRGPDATQCDPVLIGNPGSDTSQILNRGRQTQQ